MNAPTEQWASELSHAINQRPMKTKTEIDEINRQRQEAFELLRQAKRIMEKTGCSLGSMTIAECIGELIATECDEY